MNQEKQHEDWYALDCGMPEDGEKISLKIQFEIDADFKKDESEKDSGFVTYVPESKKNVKIVAWRPIQEEKEND